MGDAVTDGRRLKGLRRRRLVMDATIRVIGRAGVAGVSQRVVGAEAGVPASAVAYYFPTVDDLLLATMVDVNDTYIAALERCHEAPDPLAALAELVAAAGRDERRASTAAEFELFLLAGKDARGQREYRRWADALAAFFARHLDDESRVTVAVAAVDGLLFQSYCLPRPPTSDEVRAGLRSLVD